jgi:hypothetical protein
MNPGSMSRLARENCGISSTTVAEFDWLEMRTSLAEGEEDVSNWESKFCVHKALLDQTGNPSCKGANSNEDMRIEYLIDKAH